MPRWLFLFEICFILLGYGNVALAQDAFLRRQIRFFLTTHGGDLKYSLSTIRSDKSVVNNQLFRLVPSKTEGHFYIVSVQTGAYFDANNGTSPYWRVESDPQPDNEHLLFRFEPVPQKLGGYYIVPYVAHGKTLDANNGTNASYFSETKSPSNRNHVWFIENDGSDVRLSVALEERVPLTTGIFVDDRPSVVILIHGVEQCGTEGNPYSTFRHWAEGKLGNSYIIPFDWAEGDDLDFYNASWRIGDRADQITGAHRKVWQASAKLKELVGLLRSSFDDRLRICVVAYSHGTTIALSALQEGARIDQVVFMGSPLHEKVLKDASDGCNMAWAMSAIQQNFLNLCSADDEVAGQLIGAYSPFKEGAGIGNRGLPNDMKDIENVQGDGAVKWWQDERLNNVQLHGIAHGEWWTSTWEQKDLWPTSFPQEKVIALLGSNVPLDQDTLKPLSEFAVSRGFHDKCNQGFGHDFGADKNSSTAEWTLHIPKGMSQSFFMDDKKSMNYEIQVQKGSILAKVESHQFKSWEKRHEQVIQATAEPVSWTTRERFFDVTYWLRVESKEDDTIVRVKLTAKK